MHTGGQDSLFHGHRSAPNPAATLTAVVPPAATLTAATLTAATHTRTHTILQL